MFSKKILVTLTVATFLLISVLGEFANSVKAAPNVTQLYLSPASTVLPNIGDQATISINVDDLDNIQGVQAIIQVDGAIVTATDQSGTAGIQPFLAVGCPNELPILNRERSTVDGDVMEYANSQLMGLPCDYNPGTGTFATFNLQCVGNGLSAITILYGTPERTLISDPGGVDITPSIVNATIQCGTVTASPVAVNDAYNTPQNTALNIAAGGILNNDSDADTPNSQLTAVLNVGPSNASAFTLNANGSFSYTPMAAFVGTDSFTYHVEDPQLNSSNVATVTINVGAGLYVDAATTIVPFANDGGPRPPMFAVASGIGSTTTVSIKVDDLENIQGVQIIVQVDSTIITATDQSGTAGIQPFVTMGCPNELPILNRERSTADGNVMEYANSQLMGLPCDYNPGTGTFVNITFRCLVEDFSVSPVTILYGTPERTLISDPGGVDITPLITNGSIQCAGPTAVTMSNNETAVPSNVGAIWLAALVLFIVTAGLLVQRRRQTA